MRPSSTAGQASLEYVAVISLVAAVLVFAAPAVGAPSLADGVVEGVRRGICVVAHDVCTVHEARATGLPPCPLSYASKGYEAGATIFSVELGDREELSGFLGSDGRINLTWSAGASVGVSGGFGLELPVVFNAGVDAGGRVKVAAARGWSFPDEATAQRFVAGLPRSAADEEHWPAAWHSVQGGPDASARALVSLPGVDLASLGVTADRAAGARVGRDGTVTLYFTTAIDGPEAGVPFLPTVGRGKQSVLAEYTLGPDGPRMLALHQVVPERRGNRLVETIARVDLRNPLNAPLRRIPWPNQEPTDVDRVLAAARGTGTIERDVYSVQDRSHGVSGAVEEGWKLGASFKWVNVKRRLVDATVSTQGSKPRKRDDCLYQLR